MIEHIKEALNESHKALENLMNSPEALASIDEAANLLVESFTKGGKVMSCGNGGSMCDAMHFAEELSGKFRTERKALPAVSISDASHMSCTANDFGYDYVFSRYVEAHGRKEDVLLAISTSGTSKNIIKAVEAAKAEGLKVIAMTGKPECRLGEMSDVHIATPGFTKFADRVQELHIKCIHVLIELIERKMLAMEY